MIKKINNIRMKYQRIPLAAKASLWFVICSFMQRGITVITTPVFSRLLKPSEYGLYSVFNSWVDVITIFATLKLGSSVYARGLVFFEDDQDQFTSSLLGLSLLWWSICVIIYLCLHNFWNNVFELPTYLILCMFAMIIAHVGFLFWSTRQRNSFCYIPLVRLTLFVSILKPLLGIVFILSTDSYKAEARITSIVLVEVIMYGVLFVSMFRKSGKVYHKAYWKYALSFNFPLVPHFLAQVVLNHSDRIMIRQMVGDEAAGIYSMAYNIAMLLQIINTAIQNTMRPWMFQEMKKNRIKQKRPVISAIVLLVALVNLCLICFGPELVAIFAPQSYQGATSMIPSITMGVYFIFLYNMFVTVQMYYEKTGAIMVVSVICAVLNIVLNYLFISRYGYVAAAYTTLASYIIMAVLHYMAMAKIQRAKNSIQIPIDMKMITLISALFVTFGGLMGLVYNLVWIRYGIILIFMIGVVRYKQKIWGIVSLLKKK